MSSEKQEEIKLSEPKVELVVQESKPEVKPETEREILFKKETIKKDPTSEEIPVSKETPEKPLEKPLEKPDTNEIIYPITNKLRTSGIGFIIIFIIIAILFVLTAVFGFAVALILAVIAEYRFYKEKRFWRPIVDALKLNWLYIIYYMRLKPGM